LRDDDTVVFDPPRQGTQAQVKPLAADEFPRRSGCRAMSRHLHAMREFRSRVPPKSKTSHLLTGFGTHHTARLIR